jgi:hypothetical protein
MNDEGAMDQPASPERIIKALVAALLISGFGCVTAGHFAECEPLHTIGWWILVAAIVLACVPLALLLVFLIVDKFCS